MSDKFDMHVARKICGLAEPRTSRARSMILGHLAEHPLMSKDRIESTIDAAELLPAALDRIEELEKALIEKQAKTTKVPCRYDAMINCDFSGSDTGWCEDCVQKGRIRILAREQLEKEGIL